MKPSPWQRFRKLESDVKELERKRQPFVDVDKINTALDEEQKSNSVSTPVGEAIRTLIQARIIVFKLLFLLAFPALGAGPALPQYTPKKHAPKHTAGSREGALPRMAVMSKAIALKPANGRRWTWRYSFAPPEFTTYRFYGRPTLDVPEVLLGTGKMPVWDQWFTNGVMQVIICVVEDRDMTALSNGKAK